MYSQLSKDLTSQFSKKEKKDNGIFFTPPHFIQHNLTLLPLSEITKVLEPSCGSGEYIDALSSFPHLQITGIEKNEKMCMSRPILNMDFLEYETCEKFDLVIGNPPYFVMKKSEVDKKYHKFFDGRPNIFILFVIKSLELVKKDGFLSFVLPANFLNSLSYEKTRKHLAQYKILHIVECKEKYIETQQDTVLLIVQKTKCHDSFDLKGYTVFFTEKKRKRIAKLYENSTTLKDMGFRVKVGTVVWNQCKEILTDDPTKTRLIYSSDIVSHAIVKKKYKDEKKKNFIDKEGLSDLTLVINRGYGKGEYVFNYCLITEENYLIENHLISIEYAHEISREELMILYGKIMSSFDDIRTQEFISIYFGNNAINTTELNNILPIYL